MYTNKFKSLKQNLVNTANEGGHGPCRAPLGYATVYIYISLNVVNPDGKMTISKEMVGVCDDPDIVH